MTDDNVINFPRIGFTLTPTTTPNAPVIEPPNTPTPGPAGTPAQTRRSPLDLLACLPDPGILQPAIPTPGAVPATFQSEPAPDMVGPRLGALSLAAILAVAVAALRGSNTVMSTWWENRIARQAETDKLREARLKHQLAMQNIGDKAAQQRAKTNSRVPSSSEFGRKTLGGRSGSGGSGSGGGRGGKTNRSSKSSSSGPVSPTGKKKDRGTTKPSPPGGSGNGNGRSPKRKPKAPHRPSQGGSHGLGNKPTRDNAKKKRNGNAGQASPAGSTADVKKAAARRWKRRNKKGLDKPALWADTQQTSKNSKNGKKPSVKDTSTRPSKVKRNGKASTGHGPDTSKADQPMWRTLKKSAARRWKQRQKRARKDGHTPPIWKTDRTRTKQAPRQAPRDANTKQSARSRWERIRDYARRNSPWGSPRTTPRPDGNPGPGPRRTAPTGGHSHRRSPFENAGQAAGATTWTVERADQPSPTTNPHPPAAALTTGQPALHAAPTPHSPRPGTTRPKDAIPMPPAPVPAARDPRISKAKTQAARTAHDSVGRRMDDQHATEITLDDALDEYGAFKDDGFKTHDQALKLAGRARKLRDTLAAFAEDLAINHNLIGPLFSLAMARMSESMDLVARMADEMQVSSLEAAERSETADNDLNDAYRPYTTATADAGLATPSAPIHNQT
ncbi:hypothetical protein ACIP2X_37935 [Streptomyces sp. NPDC089424]|uniref:hypothetical protein n=1 Tax=Streptomyces sp. NPDC089424 TaxID=3365917 RepID=UPI00380B5F07